MKQYFMYGILVSYDTYLEAQAMYTLVDTMNQDGDDIRGVFTGRNSDFMIVGKILRIVDAENKEPLIVPELELIDEMIIKNLVTERYGFKGEFHYYFIRN
jgi:hypothetical protein